MGISYQSALHNISFSNPQVDGRFLDFLKAHLQFLPGYITRLVTSRSQFVSKCCVPHFSLVCYLKYQINMVSNWKVEREWN